METDPSDTRQRTLRLLTLANVALVALVSLAAFSLSFEALRDLAIRTGALPPSTAFLMPVLLDGAVVVFSISSVRLAMLGELRSERRVKLLVLAVTLASVFFNVCHSRAGWLPAVIAAVPPLVLFASFEVLLLDLRRRCPAVPAKGKGRDLRPEGPGPAPETAARKGRALAMAAGGTSRAAIARELGVSTATIRRYLAGS